MDVALSQVKRLAIAIAAVRGEQSQRDFMGEYADLVWDTLREQITEERRIAACAADEGQSRSEPRPSAHRTQ